MTYGSCYSCCLLVAAKEHSRIVDLDELDFLATGNVRKWLSQHGLRKFGPNIEVVSDGLARKHMILKHAGQEVWCVHELGRIGVPLQQLGEGIVAGSKDGDVLRS